MVRSLFDLFKLGDAMSDNQNACKTCGFLGLWNESTNTYDEATIERRRDGNFKSDHNRGHVPRCSKGAFDLPQECLEEIREMSGGRQADSSNFDAIRGVIRRARSCDKWFPHEANYTPREHDDMKLAREIQIQNQAWQANVMTIVQAGLTDMKTAQQDAERTSQQFQRELGSRLEELEKIKAGIKEGVDEMKTGGKQAHSHHVANYVLNGLAIVAGLCGAIISALIATGVLRPWE